jgi:intracellular septation protein A
MAAIAEPIISVELETCPLALALPDVGDILKRVASSVTTAVLIPAVLLWLMLQITDFTVAVLVALAWMTGASILRWATGRAVSGLLMLGLVILTVRTILALATGSHFLYFVQPVFADGVLAALFLGSLLTSRPVISRLAPDFYPVDDAVIARPGIECLLRRLTLMWGLVILLKGVITFWLLESLSTSNFVLVKSGAIAAITLCTATLTLVWSLNVGRREGLLG